MTGRVRFVHAADLHLDAPFKGVDAGDRRVREALIAATLGALDAVVEACIERDADLLILAGDVYNTADRSLRTELAFRDACVRLEAAGVRVLIARGNHDPASSRSSGIALPSNVHVFSADEVERVPIERDGELLCAVYGRSFRTSAETANLATAFMRDPADPLAIGVLHANVGGRPGHEPYAPCTLDDLRAGGMDYWALGHIHKPEVLSEDPAIVYSGCTQGLNPTDTGPRGCVAVTLDHAGATLEHVATAKVGWHATSVPADDLVTMDDVRDALLRALEYETAESGGTNTISRLELTGRSEAHTALVRPKTLDDLLADIRAAGLARDPWVWVDRLTDRTRPAFDLGSVRAGSDFAADLVRLTDGLLADDDAAREYVEAVAGPVLGVLDARDAPSLCHRELLERARDLALDRLLAEEQR